MPAASITGWISASAAPDTIPIGARPAAARTTSRIRASTVLPWRTSRRYASMRSATIASTSLRSPSQAIDVLTVCGRRRVVGQHLSGDRLHQVRVVGKGAVEVEDQRAEGHGG